MFVRCLTTLAMLPSLALAQALPSPRVAMPTDAAQAAPKGYVDAGIARALLADNARLDAEITRAMAAQAGTALRQMAADPTISTCPVGNCPPASTNSGFGGTYGGPTMSSFTVYGRSTADQHPQFHINTGLYVSHGGSSGGKGQYVDIYGGAMQGPGAGATWAMNTVSVRGACPGGPNSMFGQPGSGIPFGDPGCATPPGSLGDNTTIGYELDHSNFDGDTGTSGAFSVGLYINTLSKFSSGAGITFGNSAGQTTATPGSWHHGIEFAPNTVADATIYDISNGPFSLLTTGTHGQATIRDGATGPVSLSLTGLKSVADIQATADSPAALAVTGARSVAAFYDNSTGPAAVKVDGNHSVAAVSLGGVSPAAAAAAGVYSIAAFTSVSATTSIAYQAAAGQKVCFNGIFNCVQYNDAAGKFFFTNNANAIKASLDNSGNMILSGTLTQNGTP
jgi:hypothetical protein